MQDSWSSSFAGRSQSQMSLDPQVLEKVDKSIFPFWKDSVQRQTSVSLNDR
jgi:hypothetical protein